MKINLKTNFSFRTGESADMELPPSVTRIGDLLGYIGARIDFTLVDAGHETLRPDVEVLINGKDVSFYPDGLQTALKEGDMVDVALMPLGGG
jgi:hypothetical protein